MALNVSAGAMTPCAFRQSVEAYFIFVALASHGREYLWDLVGCELEYIQEPVRSRVFKSTTPAIQFFVKLHIEENGELEVFAIGLKKVPIKWVKDPN